MILGLQAVYPTRRAVVLAAALAPLAAGVESLAPAVTGAGWFAAAVAAAALAADLLLGGLGRGCAADLEAPETLSLGAPGEARLSLRRAAPRPGRLEVALAYGSGVDAVVEGAPAPPARGAVTTFVLHPRRRGVAALHGVFVRWSGPLHLVWRARMGREDRSILVTADPGPARAAALRLDARAPLGERAQIERGRGAEFEALRDFAQGEDVRAIDWKRSARHGRLMAKEMRAERNHTVAIAVDCGRQMSEPWGGTPRVDRAMSAALALAYASLAGGDRAALFAFDSEVRLATGAVAGRGAYRALERLTGGVDYSLEATNYTLGLAAAASRLSQRSIIAIFTEFADATGAELMLQAVGRLARTHVVLFIVFRDQELEALTGARPRTPGDVARAVVAQNLLDARRVVVDRLRRFGASVVEVEPTAMSAAVIEAYLDVKRRALV